jgi:transcriptional regulator with XRE-family HTH domain
MTEGVLSPEVGRALRVARERAGLELGRVARASGLSAAEVLRIETGEGKPSIAVLQRFAGAIGANLVDLVRRLEQGKGSLLPAVRSEPRRDGFGVDQLARAIVELPAMTGSKIDAVASAAVLLAMAQCNNNQSAAARLLGMERKAFVRRLQRARRRRK